MPWPFKLHFIEIHLIKDSKLIRKRETFANEDLSRFCTSLPTSFENELEVFHRIWNRSCFCSSLNNISLTCFPVECVCQFPSWSVWGKCWLVFHSWLLGWKGCCPNDWHGLPPRPEWFLFSRNHLCCIKTFEIFQMGKVGVWCQNDWHGFPKCTSAPSNCHLIEVIPLGYKASIYFSLPPPPREQKEVAIPSQKIIWSTYPTE